MKEFKDSICLRCANLEDETGQCHYNCERGKAYPHFKPNRINICNMCKHNYNPDSVTCRRCDEFDDLMAKVNGKKPVEDVVNHPNHYQTSSGLETIQVIEAFTEELEGIYAVDTANVIKYICRWKKKNGLQDLKKAQWYLNNLIEHVEKENK